MYHLADISKFEFLVEPFDGFVTNTALLNGRTKSAAECVATDLEECEKMVKLLRKIYSDPSASFNALGNMYSYSRHLSSLALRLADDIRHTFEENSYD